MVQAQLLAGRQIAINQHLKPTHQHIIGYKRTPKVDRDSESIIIFIVDKLIKNFGGSGGVRDSTDCQVEVADLRVGGCDYMTAGAIRKMDFIAIIQPSKG